MPSWPSSVRTSANNKATSVMGFCRPVNTLASLIGVASGRVMEESLTDLIRSIVAAPAVRACAATPLAAGTGAVLVRLTDIWSSLVRTRVGVGHLFCRKWAAGVDQGLEAVTVVPLVDVHGGDHTAGAQPERGELSRPEVSAEDQLIASRVGEAAVFAAEVVLVGDEERAQLVRVVGAQKVAGDVRPLILGRGPVLNPYPAVVPRMIMRCYVADSVDVGVRALQGRVHGDAPVGQVQAGSLGKFHVRLHADTHHHRLRR